MLKSTAVLGAVLVLSACAASDGNIAAGGPKADELALAVNWGQDGYGEGFIVKPSPGTTGDFRLKLYYRDPFSTSSTGVVNRCFGHWDTRAGVQGGTQSVGAGNWQINCTSGRRSEGTFVYDGSGYGHGEGLDQEGNRIQMVFKAEGAPVSQ